MMLGTWCETRYEIWDINLNMSRVCRCDRLLFSLLLFFIPMFLSFSLFLPLPFPLSLSQLEKSTHRKRKLINRKRGKMPEPDVTVSRLRKMLRFSFFFCLYKSATRSQSSLLENFAENRFPSKCLSSSNRSQRKITIYTEKQKASHLNLVD